MVLNSYQIAKTCAKLITLSNVMERNNVMLKHRKTLKNKTTHLIIPNTKLTYQTVGRNSQGCFNFDNANMNYS